MSLTVDLKIIILPFSELAPFLPPTSKIFYAFCGHILNLHLFPQEKTTMDIKFQKIKMQFFQDSYLAHDLFKKRDKLSLLKIKKAK